MSQAVSITYTQSTPPKWGVEAHGAQLIVDAPNYPHYSTAVVDVETLEDDKPYMIGVCGEAEKVYVWHAPFPEWMGEWLSGLKIVGHNLQSADIGWLEGFGVTQANMFFDTMIAAYVMSTTREDYSLKGLCAADLCIRWPTYKDITRKKEFIQLSTNEDGALLVRKTLKSGKLKTSLPKTLLLNQVPVWLRTNYNGMDVLGNYHLWQHQERLLTPAQRMYLEKIEMPTSRCLHLVEKQGINVDLKKLIATHVKYGKQYRKARKVWTEWAGQDVLITSPEQVKKALHRMDIKVSSTEEDSLIPYETHGAVKALLEFRGAHKICSTYTKPFYKKVKRSKDGRIRCRFNIPGTVTGRLSSAGPNLQNQPPESKEYLVPGPGNVFVLGDYSQIELRMAAQLAKEPKFISAFQQGLDIHEAAAAAIFKVAVDKVEKKQRAVGKTINFAMLFGAQAERIGQEATLTEEEAEKMLEEYWAGLPALTTFFSRTKEHAKATGTVSDMWGRVVVVPELRSARDWEVERGLRTTMSVKIQGSAATLMKLAMVRIWKRHGLVPVVSEHDALMYDVPEAEAERVRGLVKMEMEAAWKFDFPLVADVRIGRSWLEAKG